MHIFEKFNVSVLVETSTDWGREIIRGINDFAAITPGWRFHLRPTGRKERLPLPFPTDDIDGVVARVTTKELSDALEALGKPVVNVSSVRFPRSIMDVCTCDEHEIASIAAEHLLGLGFSRFGYVSEIAPEKSSDVIGELFRRKTLNAGASCAILRLPPITSADGEWRRILGEWLDALEKPAGVLAWNDVLGAQVAQVCEERGIRVPYDLAVMGGGIDELFGAVISNPPLTTVDPGGRRVGFQAATLLTRRMRGDSSSPKEQIISPIGLVARESTNILALNDEVLTRAVKFIRDNATRGIDVSDVLTSVAVGRRTLENLFKQKLNTSVAAMIRESRVEHAKRLLLKSYLPISDVAAASGFSSPEIFCRAFKRAVGKSPNAYRKASCSQHPASER